MATKYKKAEVDVSRIYLDNINPRHDPIDNEPEIIAYLVGREYVRPLAKDIADQGTTSPLERFALIPHEKVSGAYVTAEGNRRLCALKLLADPEKAPNDSHKRYFRELKSRMRTRVRVIDAVIFPTRAQANHWLALRHEGPIGGVGTRSWDARQKERFSRRGGRAENPNTQASLLLEYGLERDLITQEAHDAISVTTLTRFLKSPVFRNAMGLTTTRDLSIIVPQQEFDRVAQRFLNDAYDDLRGTKRGVHSRTKKEDWERYTHRLRGDGITPTTLLQEPQVIDALSAKVKGAPAAKKPADRTNRNPDTRRKVVPADFSVRISDKVLKRIYDELRDLDAKDFPFAAAYLLRAMIEQTVHLFCRENGIATDADLHVVIGRAADRLAKDGNDERNLKPLRVMASDKHARFSPQTLGAFVHGGLIPSTVELARYWDGLENNVRTMIERLK